MDGKKNEYLKSKEALLNYLRELCQILENQGSEPLSGESRRIFMNKFSMIDHRLLDRFDVRSCEYFEEKLKI